MSGTNERILNVIDRPFSVKEMDSKYDQKIRKLGAKLQAEKESKRKLKRKLKMKMAQKILKMKEKLRVNKRLMRQLKQNMDPLVPIIHDEQSCYVEMNISDKLSDTDNIDEICDENVSNDDEMETGPVSNFQPEEIVNVGEIANEIITFDIKFFHSYAKPFDSKPLRMHQCPDCGFKTPKKDTMVKHQAAYCVLKPVRDRKCPACEEFFTYDSLRLHLGYYSTGKHAATKKHAKYSTQEHQAMLDELKKSRT